MAGKGFHELKTRGSGLVRIVGSFELDDGSNPINLSSNAFTAVRAGPGNFLVTFREKFVDLVEAQSSVRAQNPIEIASSLGPWNPATRTLTVNLFFIQTGGDPAGTDLDPSVQNKISFSATFANSQAFH